MAQSGPTAVYESMTTYEFGGFRLDPRRRLFFRPNGEPVALKPKAFDTLLHLVEHPGELLDKTALMKAVWGDLIVEENGLNQHISALRKLLGESPGQNRFIVTVPGRGYRFVAEVRTRASTPAAVAGVLAQVASDGRGRRSRKPRMWAAGALLASLVVIASLIYASSSGPRPVVRSIAVLPLANLGDPDKAAIALGFHDEIITQLHKLNFPITPRTEVMQYAETKVPIEEIARALNVDAILEGTIRYADERFRISLSLVDVRTKRMLWRDSYDRRFEDLLAIESDIAINVGNALQAKLAPQDLVALEEGATRNVRAYELYFSARDYARRGLTHDAAAIGLYEKAVEEDPQYALAWAELSYARTNVHRWLDPDPAQFEKSREAAETALRLSPGLAWGRVAMAYYQFLNGAAPAQILADLNLVESKSRRLSEFFGVRADLNEALGLLKEALVDRIQVVALDPRNVVGLVRAAHGYTVFREYDDAERMLARATDIAPDELGMIYHRASLPLFKDGDTSKLRELEPKMLAGILAWGEMSVVAAMDDRDYDAARRLLELLPNESQMEADDGWLFGRPDWIGHFYKFAGRAADAKPLFETARQRIESRLATNPEDRGLRFSLGHVLAGLGMADDAIDSVRRGLEGIDTLPLAEASDSHFGAALTFAEVGAAELAVEQLDPYLSNPGEWSIEGLLPRPEFDPIRDDPRFLSLVARYKRH